MANLSSKTGFTPVQTRVNFSAINVATSVQDFAAYDSQELSGFVYVTTSSTGATTLRAAVKVTVNKNGAGTYEIVATDIAGDDVAGSPMVSFSLSGSVLRATLNSGITGTFGSGYIQYQLNAPALGGNFPLSVDGSQIVSGTVASARLPAGQLPGSTSGAAIAAGYIGETKRAVVLPGANQSISSTSYVAITGASLSLEAGIWAIFASVNFDGNPVALIVSLQLYDGTTQVTYNDYNQATALAGASINLFRVVNPASTTTYSLRAKVTTSSIGVVGFDRPQFLAIRIA